MKNTVYLYDVLDKLRTPKPDGEPEVFSLSFIASGSKRKGQVLRVERAYLSPGSRQDRELLQVRVLESSSIQAQAITVKKIFITEINGLKTFI